MNTITIILIATLCISVSVSMFCMGVLHGLYTGEKINKEYILGMNDHMKDFFEKIINNEEKYFNDVVQRLANAVDELNKNNETPIWRSIEDELPEFDGLYYGKKDDTTSMWKVNYRNGEWYLSGYPEHKMKVIKWTDIY